MTDLETILREIGLSEKGARVYLACLKFPNQATSILAKKTTLNRGTAFVILHELLKKGLVRKSITSDVQRFTAVPPEELVTYLDKKKFLLQKQKEKIETLLPSFKSLQGAESTKPIFQFYEGTDGLQNMISEMLIGKKSKIKGIVDPDVLLNIIGSDFAEEFEKKRAKKQNELFVLLSYKHLKNKDFKSSKKALRNARYMPEPLHFPMTSFLFGNTTILLSHQEHFGLSIQSSEYIQMQEIFFDTIWAISKKEISEKEFRIPLV